MKSKLSDVCTIKYGKDHKRLSNGNIPVYGSGGVIRYADTALYNRKTVLIPRKGTLDNLFFVSEPFWTVDTLFYTVIDETKAVPEYLYYFLKTLDLAGMNVGTAVPSLTTAVLNEIEIELPSLDVQQVIADTLFSLDARIAENRKINHHLEQMAFAIFVDMFPNVVLGEHTIGEYIVPKRGKGLLSKDAILGNVPVVAGGLSPATYHNVANTVAPVITISASGANAGFVSMWSTPVWSSDSSFIDASMSDDVYFWYVMLKMRQSEIYEAQTGSAQPHIYPKHIEILPTIELNHNDIIAYTNHVAPMFETIGSNIQENARLAELRDSLLPRLMSGELSIADLGDAK